ncbi:aldo/keto reductase [Patulibacter minatonensis]|uniref:aldo/keto reductase n=1 Tax=Patulibacter minatonensis TaxID=298163 RepID=UPI00047B20C1|nr:aldo/keto reductase [Patulibacter minatonensis]
MSPTETTPAPTVPLANGAVMPRLGLGTWPLDDREAEAAVAQAIGIGYRLIDTAFNYGNEVGVGRGLAASGVKREELFVTTKLNKEDHGVDEVQRAFERSATKLDVDYIDLLLIHWPNPAQDRYVDAYRGLVRLLEDGRVSAIGVSNFKPAHVDRVLDATGVTPDVDQIELDPTRTRVAERAYLRRKGIVCESWSPLGGQHAGLREHPTVARIAEKRGRTPGQIILRWHMELGLVTVPKSADATRQRENLEVFDFALTREEIDEISALDRGGEGVTDSDAFGH